MTKYYTFTREDSLYRDGVNTYTSSNILLQNYPGISLMPCDKFYKLIPSYRDYYWVWDAEPVGKFEHDKDGIINCYSAQLSNRREIKDLEWPDTDTIIQLIQDGEFDPFSIRYIQNQSEEMQILAVQKYGRAIRYIKNPSMVVQLAAIHKDSTSIQDIDDPSIEAQLVAVCKDGCNIKGIANPSLGCQLAAIENNLCAITHIKNPSPEVQLAAVTKNPCTIFYIDDPCLEATHISEQFRKPPHECYYACMDPCERTVMKGT